MHNFCRTFCGTASVAAAAAASAAKSRGSWKNSSSSDFGNVKETKESQQLAVGGLSVTGCLSDFSVYIFHPYGAAKRAGMEVIFNSCDLNIV